MIELDADTIRAAAAGERRGFRLFYDHYAPGIWRVAVRTLGGDSALAAQVTQDVFVRAHANLNKFKYQSAVSTWLYRIAWNRCMSLAARKRSWWLRVVEPVDIAGPDESGRAENRDLARRILAALEPDERFLLVAREVDGMPFEELAKMTGTASGALRTRLSRIKQRIREGGIEWN
jgi:RNA polymerase sigma factor (sigma-70 family)